MLIIIEGVDGTGKTTLASLFHDYYNAKILHRGVPVKHPLIEYTADLAGYRPGSGKHIVCDRWHIGELVYGPLYRGYSALSSSAFVAVDELLFENGALLVHAKDNIDVILRRLSIRSRFDEPDRAALAQAQAGFERVLPLSILPRIAFSASGELLRSVNDIASMAREVEAAACQK